MKTLKTIIISSVFFIAIAIISCNKNNFSYNATTNVRPCANIACSNGGVCVDGNCVCPNGFEGASCELKWNKRYEGTFQATDYCITGPYYNVSIYTNPLKPDGIKIENLGKFCTSNTLLDATIGYDKTSFTIPSQRYCDSTYISAKGTQTLDNKFINIFIESRDSINHSTTSCSIQLRRL